MVSDGRMPRPKRVNGRVIWDRLRLNTTVSDLSEEKAPPLRAMPPPFLWTQNYH